MNAIDNTPHQELTEEQRYRAARRQQIEDCVGRDVWPTCDIVRRFMARRVAKLLRWVTESLDGNEI